MLPKNQEEWIRVALGSDYLGLIGRRASTFGIKCLKMDTVAVQRDTSELAVEVHGEDPLLEILSSIGDSITLKEYEIVGKYSRYDKSVRNKMDKYREKIMELLISKEIVHEVILGWGRSGEGKTTFVHYGMVS